LKQLSAAKFGRPKNVVADEIFKRLETKEPPRPQIGGPAGFGSTRPETFGYKPPSSGSSFLDDWLAKRRAQGKPVPATAPAPKPPAAPKPELDLDDDDAASAVELIPGGAKQPAPKPAASSGRPRKDLAKMVRESLKTQPGGEHLGSKKFVRGGGPGDEVYGDDEIYIDKDGNMHYRREPDPLKTKAESEEEHVISMPDQTPAKSDQKLDGDTGKPAGGDQNR
jgi:hypothetical protein